MSAYSEWKCGLITDAEYNTICRREEAEQRPWWDTFTEEEEFEDDDVDEFKLLQLRSQCCPLVGITI